MTLERCPECDGKGMVEIDNNIWLDDAITQLIDMGHVKIATKMMDRKEKRI